MSKIGRFGSHYYARLEAAERSAKEKAEREANKTTSELITDAANQYETSLKVASQLAIALTKALNSLRIGDEPSRPSTWTVHTTLNFEALAYNVEVRTPPDAAWEVTGRRNQTFRYRVTEERLAQATVSVDAFHQWIGAAAQRFVDLIATRRVVEKVEDVDGWDNAVLRKVPTRDRLEVAQELRDLGFIPLDEFTPEEEAAAIDSLMRSLNQA